jgi:hydroxymethylpyrimidine pyrophosphatase-like HAD family hydrolase
MPEQAWEEVHKLFYYAAGEGTLARATQLMPAGIRLTDLGLGYAEATDERVTKATAMEAVRSWLGGDEWQTMAMGDSDNDLTMLAAADVSVAMGNGNDNVKAMATWTTTAISEDGLWNAFEHFGLI